MEKKRCRVRVLTQSCKLGSDEILSGVSMGCSSPHAFELPPHCRVSFTPGVGGSHLPPVVGGYKKIVSVGWCLLRHIHHYVACLLLSKRGHSVAVRTRALRTFMSLSLMRLCLVTREPPACVCFMFLCCTQLFASFHLLTLLESVRLTSCNFVSKYSRALLYFCISPALGQALFSRDVV